ncbi:MAG: Ig-like domain-containing protein, partial [Ruminococcus flavefaciens]|nr:Ig-like domain-containing protein [Ruminococcus flavefaciens]
KNSKGKKLSKSLKCAVTVKTPSIKLDNTTVSVNVGQTAKLTATVAPKSAAKNVKYTSSNSDIATVDNTGVITGKSIGDATVTASVKVGSKTYKKEAAVTVKEAAYTIDMTSLEVKAADTLVATFASPVKTAEADTTIKLTRGTTSVDFKPVWSEDAKTLTVKTAAKMTAGTYELTVTDKTDEKITASKTAQVEAQKVAEIKILNEVALTAKKGVGADNSQLAYVYYDVVDQYGESMRSSVSIDWSASVNISNKNTATGRLTLERADTKDFTYGEQIFITGVHTKTGLSVSKTLTVGAKQAVNSVKLGGFIKKNTTEILTSLPADFKNAEYYMLYNVLDQNGNEIETARDGLASGNTISDITFVSDTPLVIKEMTQAGSVMTLTDSYGNDKEYDTVLVVPGIKVEQGGEVKVTAIANKTGNKTEIVVPVNMGDVLKSFVIGSPADIVADGETVEIPFTATDEKGNKVTSFQTIAKQETFNKLQFSASDGSLNLKEQDDGTAKLYYTDRSLAWSDAQTTDGQDRIISLTAIVVGGETNNQMLNITDKARPCGITDVNFHSAYVEGDVVTIELTKTSDARAYISYADQYGRKMTDANAAAFFTASNGGQILGTDFSGYTYGTLVTYTGNGKSTVSSIDGNKQVFLTAGNSTETITMANTVDASATGEGCKFAVAKLKAGQYETVDRAKNFGYTVVDITKVQSISVGDINKVFVSTSNTNSDYLTITGATTGGSIITTTIPRAYGASLVDYRPAVTVTGTYAGKNDVTIPASYLAIAGTYLSDDDSDGLIDTASGLTYDDLYNFAGSTNNYARKDAEDIVTVTIKTLYANSNDAGYSIGASLVGTHTALKKTVAISDAAPEGTVLTASAESKTSVPNHTAISYSASTGFFSLKDQYGKDFAGLKFEIKEVKEADAYAANNFTVSGNDSATVNVTGAERGDTFTLTASYKKLSASIKITVGSDAESLIGSGAGNSYLDDLVNGANGLEDQRIAGLQ